MADNKDLKLAKEMYTKLCGMLDAREWTYKKNDKDLMVFFGVNGDDLKMQFVMACDEKRQLIRLMSFLPFNMSNERIVEGALATSIINYCLVDGSFALDISDGSIVFKLTSSFRDSLISDELFNYMIDLSCTIVDEYNDQLLAIDKDELSIDEFVKKNFQ